MNAGLYIVGTPIGNMQDITLRAIETLKAVTLILAEDTRHTRVLLDRLQIGSPLMSCHKFNEQSRTELIAGRIGCGEALALVTDSGMPAISDPGARVVAACRALNLPVFVVPGPSAVTAAYALSGLGGAGFLFEGFLPHKTAARRRRLAELAQEKHPVVFFESPYRLLKLMTEIQETLGSRPVFVARELTKHFEECLQGTPADILKAFAHRGVKGELVVILSPASGEDHIPEPAQETPALGDD